MNTNEQGIIQMLQNQINEHEEKIKSFQQAISALSGGTATIGTGKRRGRKPGSKNKVKPAASKTTTKSVAAKPGRKRKTRGVRSKAIKSVSAKTIKSRGPKPKGAKRGRKPGSGETMESWVLNQLNDNKAKTARTLMELYNKATGKKLEMNGFSARLAIIKNKGSVKSMKNAEDGLSYNGKAEWFENGKLKKEYLPKGR